MGGTVDDGGLSTESSHYKVLGVAADASQKQIQQAYRMASLRWHPDRWAAHVKSFTPVSRECVGRRADKGAPLLLVALPLQVLDRSDGRFECWVGAAGRERLGRRGRAMKS